MMMVTAVALIGLTSCDKNEQVQQLEPISVAPIYATAVQGQVEVLDQAILFKSTAVPNSRLWSLYKKPVGGAWTLVTGNEFIAGSAAQLDWAGRNPLSRLITNGSGNRYFPVGMDLKLVYQTLIDGVKTDFLGVQDFTATQDNFTLQMKGRQLRDILMIDAEGLKNVPNIRFEVMATYVPQTIDLLPTALSATSTLTTWPVYTYVAAGVPVTTVLGTISASNGLVTTSYPKSGNDITLFDALEKKITGTVTIVCKVYETGNPTSFRTVTKTTPASAIGSGLKLILTTNLPGWYAGQIAFEDVDINVTTVPVLIN